MAISLRAGDCALTWMLVVDGGVNGARGNPPLRPDATMEEERWQA